MNNPAPHNPAPRNLAPQLASNPAPKKTFRITTTMFLDWPQLGFALYPPDTGRTNDFESSNDVPAEVRPKLTGFIRSGHVRFYDLSPLERGEMPEEITPRVEELEDDGTHPEREQDAIASIGGKSPMPNANKPNPNAPIPQNVASAEGATGDGTPVRGVEQRVHETAHLDQSPKTGKTHKP